MGRLLSIVATIAILTGCTRSQPPPPQPSADASAAVNASLTRKLQNRWGKCLTSSYHITVRQTPDKNAAAEMAFAACASEEQALTSHVNTQVPAAYNGIAALRAGMKQVLNEKGHLEILPER